MRLKDKIAIVAGGGQGIGEGIARCLAREGAEVAIFDINGDAAARVAGELAGPGHRSLPVAADLTDEKQIRKAVQDAAAFFGRIDILVNNVGGVSPETSKLMEEQAAAHRQDEDLPVCLRFSSEAWDRFYQLNLKSHVLMSNAAAPYFVRQNSGRIVNISSVSGRFGEPGNIPYATMKAADISLTWSLAQGLAPHNVTVNCICPGFVYTPLWERGATAYLKQVREDVREARSRGGKLPRRLARFTDVDLDNMSPRDYWQRFIVRPSNPMGKEQTAEDIGMAVVYFASDEAASVTGQVLHVDGGQIMR